MSETKPTPGPWRSIRAHWGRWVVSTETHSIAELYSYAGLGGDEIALNAEQKANAHLIAAAPDMLEALRACEATFTLASGSVAAGIKIDWESLAREFNRRQKIAAAAIAKAEGRS